MEIESDLRQESAGAAGAVLRFDDRSRRAAVALAAAAGLVRALPLLAVSLTVLAGVDRAVELPHWARASAWAASVGLAAAALASGFRPFSMFSPRARSRSLAVRASRHGVSLREDELRLAAQLASAPSGSDDLRADYLASVAARLERCRPSWAFANRTWARPVGTAALVLAGAGALWALAPAFSPLNNRVLNPFSSVNLDRFVKVVPGDAQVPLGGDVEIRLEALDTGSRPELMVRTSEGWARRAPTAEGRERVYEVANVVEPLFYRVRWKGEWSRRYAITPVEPVRLSGFDVTVRAPAYTGAEPFRQTSPEITALAGSRVSLLAKASRAVASAALTFSDGQEIPVEVADGRVLSASFPVERSGTYGFKIVPADAAAQGAPETYPINVTQDLPPEIVLLSPTEALVAGEREKLPLTFDVRDDVHVAEVRLEWEVRGRTRRQTARRFSGRSTGGIFTHAWDLRGAGLRPGDLARYRLVAVDANTVTGPGAAATPWMEVAVESFEREHEALEQALGAWRDRSIDLLAQMNTLKAKIDSPDGKLDAAASDFNQSAQLSSRLEEALRQIVARMENDPLADPTVTMEHQAMLQSFQTMNRALMPQARAALNTGNRQAASSQVENIASELERMTSLSEELSKRQNARDVVDSGDRLEKLGEELAQELENAAPGDPALAAKLNEIMDEARKNLEQMANALQKMPQDLPEDFVNQQALKNMPLGKAQDLLSQIAQAVKRGDMKSAVAMAQQFLKMTQDMRETLGEANDSFSGSSSADELAQQIGEQQEKVEQLVAEQRDILAETQKLETSRLERRMKMQEGAFPKLAERQRAAVASARAAAADARNTAAYLAVASQLPAMEEVARELEAKSLGQTFELLPAIAAQLRRGEAELLKSSATASVAGRVRQVADEETAILEELKRLREQPAPPSPGEQQAFDSLRRRQEGLAKQTGEVRQGLQTLSRKTASLGLPVTQPLSKAAQEMREAGGRLGQSDSLGALPREEGALSNLLETQNGLSQAQAAMSQMANQPGGGAGRGPRVIARPGQRSGSRGSGNGRVRLPTADDYRPPREFREDLLESLKENYPKIYEDIIHRYYRRLAE